MDGDKTVKALFKTLDTDGDGITDDINACSNTPMGDEVDSVGCTGYSL